MANQSFISSSTPARPESQAAGSPFSPSGTPRMQTEQANQLAELERKVAVLERLIPTMQQQLGSLAPLTHRVTTLEGANLTHRVTTLENANFANSIQRLSIRHTLQGLTIYFAPNGTTPRNPAEYERNIRGIVNVLQTNEGIRLRIQGHSNSHSSLRGGRQLDMVRAQERANTVADQLISRFEDNVKQATRERLAIEQKGNTLPLIPGKKDPQNCRVTFSLQE